MENVFAQLTIEIGQKFSKDSLSKVFLSLWTEQNIVPNLKVT